MANYKCEFLINKLVNCECKCEGVTKPLKIKSVNLNGRVQVNRGGYMAGLIVNKKTTSVKLTITSVNLKVTSVNLKVTRVN